MDKEFLEQVKATPMNYDGKSFKLVDTTTNGDVDKTLIFTYRQQDETLTCEYHSDTLQSGHILGIVAPDGVINMRYHHIKDGAIKTGRCKSVPEVMSNGKIRLRETWQWTCDDHSAGSSVLEEL